MILINMILTIRILFSCYLAFLALSLIYQDGQRRGDFTFNLERDGTAPKFAGGGSDFRSHSVAAAPTESFSENASRKAGTDSELDSPESNLRKRGKDLQDFFTEISSESKITSEIAHNITSVDLLHVPKTAGLAISFSLMAEGLNSSPGGYNHVFNRTEIWELKQKWRKFEQQWGEFHRNSAKGRIARRDEHGEEPGGVKTAEGSSDEKKTPANENANVAANENATPNVLPQPPQRVSLAVIRNPFDRLWSIYTFPFQNYNVKARPFIFRELIPRFEDFVMRYQRIFQYVHPGGFVRLSGLVDFLGREDVWAEGEKRLLEWLLDAESEASSGKSDSANAADRTEDTAKSSEDNAKSSSAATAGAGIAVMNGTSPLAKLRAVVANDTRTDHEYFSALMRRVEELDLLKRMGASVSGSSSASDPGPGSAEKISKNTTNPITIDDLLPVEIIKYENLEIEYDRFCKRYGIINNLPVDLVNANPLDKENSPKAVANGNVNGSPGGARASKTVGDTGNRSNRNSANGSNRNNVRISLANTNHNGIPNTNHNGIPNTNHNVVDDLLQIEDGISSNPCSACSIYTMKMRTEVERIFADDFRLFGYSWENWRPKKRWLKGECHCKVSAADVEVGAAESQVVGSNLNRSHDSRTRTDNSESSENERTNQKRTIAECGNPESNTNSAANTKSEGNEMSDPQCRSTSVSAVDVVSTPRSDALPPGATEEVFVNATVTTGSGNDGDDHYDDSGGQHSKAYGGQRHYPRHFPELPGYGYEMWLRNSRVLNLTRYSDGSRNWIMYKGMHYHPRLSKLMEEKESES